MIGSVRLALLLERYSCAKSLQGLFQLLGFLLWQVVLESLGYRFDEFLGLRETIRC